MKLTLFPADKGDCLLLTSADGHHMLIDGGMGPSYRKFVEPVLGEMQARDEELDVVCVSHIDRDHIQGVLNLFQAELDWRVHEFQRTHDNPGHEPPAQPRPPKVGEVWHNAFAEMVEENTGPIEQMLAHRAAVLSAAEHDHAGSWAAYSAELAASVGEGITLSRRIGPKQLKIPLNPRANGKLMMARSNARRIKLGTLKITVLAPFEEDLKALRKEWNQWLVEERDQLHDIRRRADRAEATLATRVVDTIIGPAVSEANQLAHAIDASLQLAGKVGDRGEVTVPNLASIMLLVEEGSRSMLLTGDGHSDEIVKGLKVKKRLDARGRLHVDLLKVQHHGAEFNARPEFWSAITADHYVFCANGAHHNPDERILDDLLDARLGTTEIPSAGPTGKRFKIWVNSSSAVTDAGANQAHMKKVEALLARRASPQFDVEFRSTPGGGMEITL